LRGWSGPPATHRTLNASSPRSPLALSIYTSAINTFSQLLQPTSSTHPPPGSTPCIGSFGAGAGRCPPLAALLACAPSALVLEDARPSALLALADARPLAPRTPAFVPDALVRADTSWLLLRGAPRRVGLSAHPPLASNAASWICMRAPHRSLPLELRHLRIRTTAYTRIRPIKWCSKTACVRSGDSSTGKGP
jgi:hypothetical protein